MINIKCANYTIIELHDLHKSFDSSIVFLTEVQHHECALNIPICPTGTMVVSPDGLSGILHRFRQLPGTPGQSQIQDFPKEGAPFVLSAKSTRFSGGGG